jgi:hypothetical protein
MAVNANKMLKNVAQALKITNDSQSADSKDTKKEEGSLVPAAKDGAGGFLVRQSRKKLSKFVSRIRHVKRLSSMRLENKKEAYESATKDKLVKFKLDDDQKRRIEDAVARYADSDEDDEEAYVSACEALDDGEETEPCAEPAAAARNDNNVPTQADRTPAASGQMSRNQSEDDLDGKLVLPEELCDIPTFLYTQNSDPQIIEETRKLLRERYAKNPDSFYEQDYKLMLEDDWTVTRFLLRRRLDPKRTAKLMEECGKFRRQYLMGEVQLWEFPIEFHLAGGLFKYAPDRVGNVTMYMRVKMYRRVPEISDVFKAFILCVLEQCDRATNGRGTAVVFDLTGAGLQNVDLGFLYWLLNSFRNYCPKGVSYILVYNLPWFLSATAKLAMSWMSETNRRSLRFVQGKEIEKFIAPECLPDYLGGTCPIDYRAVPEGSRPAVEVCQRMNISVEQALKIKELFKEYLPEDYEASRPAPSPAADSIGSGTTIREGPAADDQNEQDDHTDIGPDNSSQGSSSTLAADSVPVVELVSKASQFMATS